jgi:hypothetical protein
MRRALSVLLAASIAALPAMAHASPPDPAWIAGLYDDGDQDDLVCLAAWAIGATVAPPVGVLCSLERPAPASSAPSPARSRAPPIP